MRPLPLDEQYRGFTEGSYEVVFAKTIAAIELGMPKLSKAWDALVDIFDLFHRLELPPVARRWQDAMSGAGFGRRSRQAWRVRMLPSKPGCRRR